VSQSERVVVAGAGLAGFRTAEGLRKRGYAGRITLIGAEDRPPYDRPPLSKKVLTDGAPSAGGMDPSLHADFAALDVDFRPGETATGLEVRDADPVPNPWRARDADPIVNPWRADDADPVPNPWRARDAALLTNHGKYPFDHLVVATGAVPVALPGPGPQRFLRTYDDALALRALLRPGLRLAIVGAGWIGAEVATAAAAAGCAVTVVEAGPAPLAAALGAEVGARTVPWYGSARVELRTGTAVESVQPGGLALADGGWLAADGIVTAVGVRPAVGWLADSGLTLDNGVTVDAGLRASLPGVYAAGDCAAFESRLFGRRLRVEHWDVALHAPEVIAANILGGAEAFDPVPYVWSEQFGRLLQYAGHHGPADRLVWRGDPEAEKWSACWLSGSRLVAILTVGRPRDLLQGRHLIAARAAVALERLADPEIPVKATAA
jgi:3-phenylpropionate/trans-cinnamate dioxygenase ferredoxin reductase component